MAGDVVVATVEPRLTAVVAETTTWEAFPALWARLLDEVYAVVRPRPELSPEPGPGPQWQNVMLYKDDRPAASRWRCTAATTPAWAAPTTPCTASPPVAASSSPGRAGRSTATGRAT